LGDAVDEPIKPARPRRNEFPSDKLGRQSFEGALWRWQQAMRTYNQEMAIWRERQRRFGRTGQRFEKYTSSENRNTRVPQTDLLFGEKGTKGGHIAVNDSGQLRHVRDDDGTVLYDRGDPPYPGWEE